MKQLFLWTLLAIAGHASAQWHTDLQAASGTYRPGLMITKADAFWIEGNALYSKSAGKRITVCPADAVVNDAYITFADDLYGVGMVHYFYQDVWYYTLLQTEDGGNSWVQLSTTVPGHNRMGSVINDPYKALIAIAPGDWVLNCFEKALRSLNQGGQWQNASFNNDTSATLVWNKNSQNLIVRSKYMWFQSDFTLHKTANSGSNWSLFFNNKEHLPDSGSMQGHYDIGKIMNTEPGKWYILRHHYVAACGLLYVGSDLFYSADDGAHWDVRPLDIDSLGYEPPSDILFADNDTGFLAAGHIIYRTTDGGHSWKIFSRTAGNRQVAALYKSGNTLSVKTSDGSIMSHSASKPDNASHIASINSTTTIVVYPNPVSGDNMIQLNVRGVSIMGKVLYKLYDATGKYIASGIISSTDIHLPYLAQGTYTLRFSENNTLFETVSFIVQ